VFCSLVGIATPLASNGTRKFPDTVNFSPLEEVVFGVVCSVENKETRTKFSVDNEKWVEC
jgi:hypothetical protein